MLRISLEKTLKKLVYNKIGLVDLVILRGTRNLSLVLRRFLLFDETKKNNAA